MSSTTYPQVQGGEVVDVEMADTSGSSGTSGQGSLPEGGLTFMVAFGQLDDGPLASSNGDGPEDPSGFMDVSEFSGGTAGLLAVRSRELRIDPSLASSAAACKAYIIQQDPLFATAARSSFYTGGVRMPLGFGPVKVPVSAPPPGSETYIGFALADVNGDGWQLDIAARWTEDGLQSRRALFPTDGYAILTDDPLHSTGWLDGNLTAGMNWVDHNSDGTWEFSFVGTSKASGSGLFDQRDTTLLAITAGQRNLEGDPIADFWVPMRGWATTQPGVPFYTFGPSAPVAA